MNKLRSFMLSLALSAATIGATQAQDLPETRFKVIGGWSNVTMTTVVEQPFWQKTVPETSGGKITADYNSLDTLGLKGDETLRLLKLKVADFITGPISFVAGDFKLYDGLDLPGAILDIDDMRKAVDAYAPVIQKNMADNFNARLMMMYPSPPQVLFCKGKVEGIGDLAGKKVRTFNQTLADFVEAVGGTPVNMSFAEVVPALQNGTVDCAITGTGPGNSAKWWEVTDHLYPLVLGWAPNFIAVNLDTWNGLDEPTRKFMTDAYAKLNDEMWAHVAEVAADGVNCNTGIGECKAGVKANMKLVEVSEADRAALAKMVTATILPRWAARCGEACVADWNGSVGKLLGFTAKAK